MVGRSPIIAREDCPIDYPPVRRLKSVFLEKSNIESFFDAIATAQDIVDRYSRVVGMLGKRIPVC